MSKTMKLSSKIYLGFGATILVCTALGAYGIWNFSEIKRESTKLTEEYVPEVNILSELERNTHNTMYEMRGYSYSGDPKYFEKVQANFAEVEAQIKQAEVLNGKAKYLTRLKTDIDDVKSGISTYKGMVVQTKEVLESVEVLRDNLDKASGEFVKETDAYMESQNQALEQEFKTNVRKEKLFERIEKLKLINDVIDLGNDMRVGAWKGQARNDMTLITAILPNAGNIANKVSAIRKMTTTDTNLRQLDNIAKSAEAYRDALQKMLDARTKLAELNAKRNEAGGHVLEIVENTAKAGFTGTNRVAESSQSIVSSSILTFAIGLIIAIVLATSLAYLISSNVARALRGFIEKLRDSSRQVTESSTQLSSAAQQLSGASNEQASSIEETSSSLEEISGMIENNVSNAEQAYRLSNEVMKVSESANTSMKKLEVSIKEILQSNDKIEQLVRVIGNIGEKTKIMDEIVFQTKLLSFNASVEAERAGEHGRGFAVVAQEVGNLAQMSGKSAQEIAEIVKSSIQEAEAITAENRKKVDLGNTYVEESARGLKQIMEAASTVSSGANQVLQASKDQASGIKQVNVAMTQLDTATQQNAATSEETAASSEELNAQALVLNGIVSDLYVLVEGQRDEVTSRLTPPRVRTIGTKTASPIEKTKVVSLAGVRKETKPNRPQVLKQAAGGEFSVANEEDDSAWDSL